MVVPRAHIKRLMQFRIYSEESGETFFFYLILGIENFAQFETENRIERLALIAICGKLVSEHDTAKIFFLQETHPIKLLH